MKNFPYLNLKSSFSLVKNKIKKSQRAQKSFKLHVGSISVSFWGTWHWHCVFHNATTFFIISFKNFFFCVALDTFISTATQWVRKELLLYGCWALFALEKKLFTKVGALFYFLLETFVAFCGERKLKVW